MKRINIKNTALSALFLCIGLILPLFTSQIKEIGDTLLPMHIPVMLCGFICSYGYGFTVGLILPFLRSFMFSMPPFYPNAVWMSAELAVYGLVTGLVYSFFKVKNLRATYISLISAMLLGRVVWGITKAVLMAAGGKSFTLTLFIAGGFVDALPGIILQLVIIPIIMILINRRRVIK